MKYYNQNNDPFDQFDRLIILIVIIAFVTYTIAPNNFIRAILVSYFLIGGVSDFFVNRSIGNIWSRKSLMDVHVVNTSLLSDLHQVSWLPRIVGILERIIFTTSFIIGRYEFIGAWLVLKVIGSWKNNSYDDTNKKKNIEKKENREKLNPELWRIRENIFLIGTALSLISSFLAAFLYLQIINQQSNFFYKKPLQVQPKVIHFNHHYQDWPIRD